MQIRSEVFLRKLRTNRTFTNRIIIIIIIIITDRQTDKQRRLHILLG